jgi:hypothetical protein
VTLPGPSLFQAYANRLCTHAHCLIAEGYARMEKAAFASELEPAITGELVRQMRAYLESGATAPTWAVFYTIHDDPPRSVVGKLGIARPRVDIEFERVVSGPRPRLQFEAKRLDTPTGHTVSGYLGKDGLGCFTSGRYPMTHHEAGMLGYVQSETEEIWADRIELALRKEKAKYMATDPPFSYQRLHSLLRYTYRSHHRQGKRPEFVTIHHILLRFN